MNKRLSLVAVAVVVMMVTLACSLFASFPEGTPDECKIYDYKSEEYYYCLDYQETQHIQELERARATQMSWTSTPAPTRTPAPPTPTPEYDGLLCTTVESGDTVYAAARRANNGIDPPTVFTGVGVSFAIYHKNGTVEIMLLSEAFTDPYPIIDIGEIVCIDVSPAQLEEYAPFSP